MRRAILPVALPALMFLVVAPAGAITDGYPDGSGHPMVGALVWYDPELDAKDWFCSGSLLSPTVFLTAAHCLAWATEEEQLWVTFDPEFDAINGVFVPVDDWTLNPQWSYSSWVSPDMAVITFATDDAVILDDYAKLPYLGQLDDMKADGSLRSQSFTNVGYGCWINRGGGGGRPTYECDGVRRYSTSTYGSLTPVWLRLNQNPNSVEGQGGIGGGDSGGPHFLADTFTTVASTVWSASWAAGPSFHVRLDTPAAQEFLNDFVAVPEPPR